MHFTLFRTVHGFLRRCCWYFTAGGICGNGQVTTCRAWPWEIPKNPKFVAGQGCSLEEVREKAEAERLKVMALRDSENVRLWRESRSWPWQFSEYEMEKFYQDGMKSFRPNKAKKIQNFFPRKFSFFFPIIFFLLLYNFPTFTFVRFSFLLYSPCYINYVYWCKAP